MTDALTGATTSLVLAITLALAAVLGIGLALGWWLSRRGSGARAGASAVAAAGSQGVGLAGDLGAEVETLNRRVSHIARQLLQLRNEFEVLSTRRDPISGEIAAPAMAAAGAPDDPVPMQMDAAGESAIPVPPGRPVDLHYGTIVPSQALEATGLLVVSPGRSAELFLNPAVEIDHISFKDWSNVFEFGGGAPYVRYRTTDPALVDWNENAGRGVLKVKGTARPL
jgi:hypothetical protein